jgi:hypothetical protein
MQPADDETTRQNCQRCSDDHCAHEDCDDDDGPSCWDPLLCDDKNANNWSDFAWNYYNQRGDVNIVSVVRCIRSWAGAAVTRLFVLLLPLQLISCREFNPCYPVNYEELARLAGGETCGDEPFPWVGRPPNYGPGEQYQWEEPDFAPVKLTGVILQVNLSEKINKIEAKDCERVIVHSAHEEFSAKDCSFVGGAERVNAEFEAGREYRMSISFARSVSVVIDDAARVTYAPPTGTIEHNIIGQFATLSYGQISAYTIDDVKRNPQPSIGFRLYAASDTEALTDVEREVAGWLASTDFQGTLIIRRDNGEREVDFRNLPPQ